MEESSAIQPKEDNRRGQEGSSIFEDDRSFHRDPDSATANLLVPSRPQSQRFHSHDNQVHDSRQNHTSRLWQVSLLLFTIVLSAFIFAAIKIYQSKGNFTSAQKHTFNTISTALVLALGLNFFVGRHRLALTIWRETHSFMAAQEAFKSLAKGSRSRILKQRYYNPRERELIFNIENLTDVITLAWVSRKRPWVKPWTTIICIAWVSSCPRLIPYHICPLSYGESSHMSLATQNVWREFLPLTVADVLRRSSLTL